MLTVTVTGHGDTFAMGPIMVRYAWAAVPFQYKAAVLYSGDSMDEMLPAGGFVAITK